MKKIDLNVIIYCKFYKVTQPWGQGHIANWHAHLRMNCQARYYCPVMCHYWKDIIMESKLDISKRTKKVKASLYIKVIEKMDLKLKICCKLHF